MRIAYVITRADLVAGAQVHVRDLATAVRDAGHEVTVLAGSVGVLADALARQRVPFRQVPDLVREITPQRDVAALRQLKALLKELQPDLIATHSSKAGWLGRLAAHRLRVPVIFTAHGWAFADGVPWSHRTIYRLAERVVAPLADHIITVSEYDRALALAHRIAPADRITCIHNGVHDVRPRDGARSPGPVRILKLGRFSAQKDHASLLRALAELRPGSWVLDLAGDGPDQARVAALAAELGIAASVHVLGSRNDVADLLRRSDIYALISRWEGLPYSILEAMSAAVPVIASDVGGVREAIVDGGNGILVPRGDVVGLRHALAGLIEDATRRQQLGTAGRVRYEREFRFETMLARTLALYERVANASTRATGGRDCQRS